jgi:CHAT domain-containing protein/Tfp pilus assembly protein PilF
VFTKAFGLSIVVSAAFLSVVPAQAQRIDIEATNNRYQRLYASGNYGAALVEARKLEQAVRRLGGTNHPNYPLVLEFVGNSLTGQGQYTEAVETHQRVLAIREKMYGAGSAQAASSLNNIGNAKLRQGLYAEAEDYMARAASIQQQLNGANSHEFVFVLNNLGVIYLAQGKFSEAEKVRKHVLAVYEQTRGPDDPAVGDAIGKLADLYRVMGRYAEAEPLFRRALSIQERPGASQIEAARTHNNLGIMHFAVGKHSDAEVSFKRALTIEEQIVGPSHPMIAEVVQNLGAVLKSQCRYDEAANLAQRAIAIREKALGRDHPDLASTFVNLANVYSLQKKFDEADPLYRRALSIQERALGSEHPNVSYTLHNLGYAAEAQKRHDEAEAYYRRTVAIRERTFGQSHPEVATSLGNLGNTLIAAKKYDEAAAVLERAWTIQFNTLGPDHADTARVTNNRAQAELRRGNAKAALDLSRKATDGLLKAAATASSNDQGGQGCLVEDLSNLFTTRIAALAATAGAKRTAAAASEAFEMAQWANHSAAAAALQQMGLRFAAGTGALSALVRENQDLIAAARERDKALVAAISKPAGQQDNAAIAQIRQTLTDIRGKLADAGARLEKQFPDFVALTTPKPLAIKDAQALLGPDEALVLWIASEDKTELFMLTREGADWHTLPIGAEALTQKVAAFRRGLSVDAASAGAAEQFDLALAHAFYKELLGPAEAVLKRKRNLLLVPSGALTAVPFQLLVTAPPAAASGDLGAYRNAAWLVKQNAVTVVPSVSALKALRVFAAKDQATKPIVGFGDPVFDPGTAPAPAPGGQRAAAKTKAKPVKTANAARPVKTASRSAGTTRSYSDFWQGASVDPALLGQALGPLPDTADEIRDVAKRLGAADEDIFLGRAASEARLKSLPLSDYRIVYFATHGLVAGDVKGLAEPSLALTIPRTPTAQDDGLLTASEIAQLKLNADFVVLSACNTIAGEKPGAEALSGLARAFFYAGTRALLVTHWAVDSAATTTIATTTFANLKADAKLGRAEAMRRAMVSFLSDETKPEQAYPGYWGAFAIVGEGVRH